MTYGRWRSSSPCCLGQVVFQQPAPNKEDHGAAIRAALTARNNPEAPIPVEHTKADKEEIARKPYQFLLVNVLREYLAFEMRTPVSFAWDQERIFDDFGALLASPVGQGGVSPL